MGLLTRILNVFGLERRARPGQLGGNNPTRPPSGLAQITLGATLTGKERSSVVAAALDRREDLAGVPMKAYKWIQGNREPQPDSDLQKLLDAPNPYMTTSFMNRRLIQHTLLAGNSYFLKNRGASRRKVLEIWPIMPQLIEPIPDNNDFLKGYWFTASGGKKVFIPPEDIIHHQRVSPADDYTGRGVFQDAWSIIRNEMGGVQWQTELLFNQGIISGILGIEDTSGADNVARITAQLENSKMGGGSGGSMIVLDGIDGVSFQKFSLSPMEAGLAESRQITREDIMSAFQVPPPILGYYDRATFSNIKEAREIFWKDTHQPFAAMIAETLTNQLAKPDYGDEWEIDFDFSGVDALQEALSDKLTNAERLIAMGVAPADAFTFLDISVELPAGALANNEPQEEETE